MSANMLGEALRTVCGPLGDLNQKLSGPSGEEWLAALKQFLRKENPWDGVAISTFSCDMAKEGWELVENVSDEPLSAANLELVFFLKGRESHVSGEEMRKRAKQKNANLGQRQVEYLLANQEEIPREWRDFYLTFPGTLWRGRGGRLRVPGLRWDGGGWDLDFYWLENDWSSGARLLSRK